MRMIREFIFMIMVICLLFRRCCIGWLNNNNFIFFYWFFPGIKKFFSNRFRFLTFIEFFLESKTFSPFFNNSLKLTFFAFRCQLPNDTPKFRIRSLFIVNLHQFLNISRPFSPVFHRFSHRISPIFHWKWVEIERETCLSHVTKMKTTTQRSGGATTRQSIGMSFFSEKKTFSIFQHSPEKTTRRKWNSRKSRRIEKGKRSFGAKGNQFCRNFLKKTV